MIVEIVRDSSKRYCAVCKKRILKGKAILKYESVIDGFGNTRMFFSHLDCIIRKLQATKKKVDAELKRIPKISYKIERYSR